MPFLFSRGGFFYVKIAFKMVYPTLKGSKTPTSKLKKIDKFRWITAPKGPIS
jgi:hypothetical protein